MIIFAVSFREKSREGKAKTVGSTEPTHILSTAKLADSFCFCKHFEILLYE